MDCEECLNDQIGSMSLTGQEPRPPMYVYLRYMLAIFQLRECIDSSLDCLSFVAGLARRAEPVFVRYHYVFLEWIVKNV